MLKVLRNKKTAKKIWIILALIIVPAFVLWGSGSISRSKQEAPYAGKIFGKKIPLSEYKDALEAVRNEAFIQYGDKFSEIQKTLNLEYRAWERLILLYEAQKRKLNVDDKEVIKFIATYPFFQRNGKFDNKSYSEILQYVFHTQPRIFEEQTRQTLMISKLYKQVTENINLNDKEVKEEYRKLNEEISVYYIAAIPSDFAKDINPSEKEIKDYFTNNSLQFKQPPSFNMDYITTESEDKIKNLTLLLNKKADFAKIAKDAGVSLKETGLFAQTDPIPGIGWSPEILSLVSKLKVNQYTPVIRSDKSYYILRLKEIKEAYIPDFEKVKDRTKEAFVKNQAEKIAEDKIKECLKELKESLKQKPASIDLSKIAKTYGLKFNSTPRFKFGSYIENVGASDILWSAADEIKEGETSGIIRMPSAFCIIKLKERIPLDQSKFAKEEAEFRLSLLFQRKQETFFKFVEDLKRKAQ